MKLTQSIQAAFFCFQLTFLVCDGKSSQFIRRLPQNQEPVPDSQSNTTKLVIPDVTSMSRCAILCHKSDCEAFDFDSDQSTCTFVSYNDEPGKSFFINSNIESCHSLQPGHPSGVYTVKASPQVQAKVFCEMGTDVGGWTVIQNRFDGSQNFNLNWNDYKVGFGEPQGEYWIGNENTYLLTSSQQYKLRIELSMLSGEEGYAEYGTFSVTSESDFYRLQISDFSGNLFDSFKGHNNNMFSTPDKDNDGRGPVNCALKFRGDVVVKCRQLTDVVVSQVSAANMVYLNKCRQLTWFSKTSVVS
ncbi:Angiopoietin-related protein 1 [Mizuhopecten yessoensis]|uniref:Angiopoietin-related protein 1 n=1 Tax=Mizuhopecten yessoensis TaxID=6573 RepID=A0A210PHW9_MIZYE|nr:Angiopoietin-related protein 1 [Mizuhopecten yessoensis]